MRIEVTAGGRAAVAGAAAAIVGNFVVLLASARVADDVVSYPLTSGAFAIGQVWFAATQAAMTVGIWAYVRSGLVSGRTSGTFGRFAVIGMALTVVGELALIPVASESADSGKATAASSVFGLGILLADVGLIGVGVAAVRQRRWPLLAGVLPIALGLFQLLIVTPISFTYGFASLASFLAIAAADVLVALMGFVLLRRSAGGATVPSKPAHELARDSVG